MLKKHLIPCTVILGLLVMAKVFAYKLPTKVENLKKDNYTNSEKKTEEPVFSIAQLEFAEETLPIGDTKVTHKMKRTLASFSYENLQTTRLHKKAAEWFPVIEPILAAYGIPNDFKYVPLVESGLRAGVSPKGAAGFWQFMPGTARMYGLKVNSKVDERYNLKKSTIAAAKYIKELYDVFDSWTLVAAAYNVGDNHMRRQINRQKQDNYFKMKLNRETGAYVYKLISMKEILENPNRNGYKNQKALIAFKQTEETNATTVE
ncbi:lytic transglycosylase domain-containing protein [Pedobacter sp.]|uniref:lytic transglycosylase domain-containing protein n=1 Tax=Pedobacter sp. TaxID=1411316 RepID=UPI0031DFD9EE